MKKLVRHGLQWASALGLIVLVAAPATGAVIYNNLTPNNLMAIAARPDTPGSFEIEAGDDFILGSRTSVNGASFVGLFVPGSSGTPSVSQVVVEVYRVFPHDSNTARTPNVPTRANS